MREYTVPMTAAILAGGQSRRMGTDKASLEIAGQTLLERTARVALNANLPVLVVGRNRPSDWLLEATFVEDAQPGLGPLGGLVAALRQTQAPVLALACDLPLLTKEALGWLFSQYEEQSDKHGLVTVNGSQWEPLFSIYSPALLPQIEQRLAENRRSLHGLIESEEFAFVQIPEWITGQLLNVNTLEDWQKIGTIREGQNC